LDAKCINEISDSESNPDLIISKYRRIKEPKPAHLLLTNALLDQACFISLHMLQKMLSIRATYDGKNLHLSQAFSILEKE